MREFNRTALACFCVMSWGASAAHAQIYNWQTGELIPGTERFILGPSVNLTYWNTEDHHLRYADFSGGLDLRDGRFWASWLDNARFIGADLSKASFSGAELTHADLSQSRLVDANFYAAILTNANLAGADIRGARFGRYYDNGWQTYQGTGLTAAQLYSTASYKSGDLQGVNFTFNNMVQWNLAGKDLTGANLYGADLWGTDFTDAVIKGTDFSTNWYASYSKLSAEQLCSTASYKNGDLQGIKLAFSRLSVSLAGKNLTNASFLGAGLYGIDLTDAIIKGANLGRFLDNPGLYVGSGPIAAQFYSTASYKSGDLQGISLEESDLTGFRFADQNLTGASFENATLTNANFVHACLIGASFENATLTNANLDGACLVGAYFYNARLTGVTLRGADVRGTRLVMPDNDATDNLIRTDGTITGLLLLEEQTLLIRNDDGGGPNHSPIAITIQDYMGMTDRALLKIILEDGPWNSTISFAPNTPIALDGALELTFAPGVDVGDQIGRTLDLFNWDGVRPSGRFTVTSAYEWDLTKLYSTGEVTLLTPEPTTSAMLILGALAVHRRKRR